MSYDFDEIGRRFTRQVGTQPLVTYGYDHNSRLKQVTQGATIVGLNYDDAGRRTSLTYPNGVTTTYSYDEADRLVGIAYAQGPTPIESVTYTHDAADNRISMTRANGPATLLPSASSAQYDAANEQTQFNSGTLTYDLNGNLLSDGVDTYTWDALDRLTAISGPGLSASFTYDALGRRISKTINGVTTTYQYDGDNVVAEGGAATASYLGSLGIDEPFLRQGATSEYYLADGLGSTLALTDANGAASSSYAYEPFGKTAITGASTNPFQFTGRENDGTGLYYYRARYYNPALGRFISEDPLEFDAGDLNLYVYVFNSPTNYTDPSGEFVFVPLLLFCGRGILSNVAFDIALDFARTGRLSGRKVDWAGALTGCIPGIGQLNKALKAKKGTAAVERAKNLSKGVDPKDIGPSGKPKIHTVEHSSRKDAKDAARNEGKGPPISHPSHYHSTDDEGVKIIGGAHHNY
jgi:RHS repeat-associated protein